VIASIRCFEPRFLPTLALALTLCGTAAPGTAAPLIRFTDGAPGIGLLASLSDLSVNWAVAWTQSVATSNVTLSAVLSSNVGPTTGNWYVTQAIGAGTSNASVVASGVYDLTTVLTADQQRDFDLAPRTLLGSGLSFAPGSYYLVLDGPAGPIQNNATWIGDVVPGLDLAPGFAVGEYFSTTAVAAFAPAGDFALRSGVRFVFELDGDIAVIPLPASLPLLAAGLAVLGLIRRRAFVRA